MPMATESLARGDATPSTPPADVLPLLRDAPEWHTLRLFGRGRHSGAFRAGVETPGEV